MLADLPVDHHLRTTALSAIGAEVGTRGMTNWRKIGPHWGIGKSTYNDLGPSWTETSQFRVALE
jgi:hypothetical protein